MGGTQKLVPVVAKPGAAAVSREPRVVERPPLAEGSLSLRIALKASKVTAFIVNTDPDKSDRYKRGLTNLLLPKCASCCVTPVSDLSSLDLRSLHGNSSPDILVLVLFEHLDDSAILTLNQKIEELRVTHPRLFVAVFYGPDGSEIKGHKVIADKELLGLKTPLFILLSEADLLRPISECRHIIRNLEFYERDP